MGCGYLKHFHVAENAKYISEIFLLEALASLTFTIRKKHLQGNKLVSLFFPLMIDDTTDVSVTEQLILYFHYMQTDGNIKTFGGIAKVLSCTGENICKECVNFQKKTKCDWREKMRGLASDGASSTTGVRTCFKKEIATLVYID